MRYFFHYFLVIPTNFRHSFGHPQNETPHNRRAQPSRNALFFRSTAPPSAKCSAAPEAAAKHKDRLPNVSFSRRSSVAPAGVEPTMGESKSPALPLGDGAPVRTSIVEFLSFVKQKRFAVSVQSVLPHFYHIYTVSLSSCDPLAHFPLYFPKKY